MLAAPHSLRRSKPVALPTFSASHLHLLIQTRPGRTWPKAWRLALEVDTRLHRPCPRRPPPRALKVHRPAASTMRKNKSLSSSTQAPPWRIWHTVLAVLRRVTPEEERRSSFSTFARNFSGYALTYTPSLNVDIRRPQRIGLDKVPPRLHLIPHQHREHTIGLDRIVDLHS